MLREIKEFTKVLTQVCLIQWFSTRGSFGPQEHFTMSETFLIVKTEGGGTVDIQWAGAGDPT